MKNHLKRISAPKSWEIARKTEPFVAKPNPGMHSLEFGFSLSFAMRDMLKLANTKKEVKDIIKNQEVLVDGKKRNDEKFNIGFMDVLSLPLIKKQYRCTFNKKGRLDFKEIPENESSQKLVRVKGKTPKGKKLQLNLGDGRNILVDKADYKINDSIIIEIPTQKIVEHIPFTKGATILLTGGKHTGSVATVESIEGEILIFKTEKAIYETNTRHAFAIGKTKPALTIQ